MHHVELRNVTKRYGNFQAITNLGLGVDKGSFTALLGPSGCGKSTLLRMIAGLEEITEGQCFINGTDVTTMPPAQRRCAMVFQSYALYPHMTVAENIGFSLSLARTPKNVIKQRVDVVANMLQLGELLDRRPAQLSGGQRQRVAIGRALVREPEVFLFDEPLSNLDAKLRVQMRFELENLHHDLKATMIYVTHDQVEAMTLADKIVVLDKGEISQIGSPLELYNNPDNKFVASFIGSPAMNFLGAQVDSAQGKSASLSLPGGAKTSVTTRGGKLAAGAVELGIRPEHLSVLTNGDSAAALSGTVRIVEQLGNSTILYVDSPAGQLVIEGEGNLAAASGDNIGIGIDSKRAHLFGADQRVV
jgi:multiple sugar transport system ATP-binding protein